MKAILGNSEGTADPENALAEQVAEKVAEKVAERVIKIIGAGGLPEGAALPPDGKLWPIKCTVEGFEHITVHFKTDNLWHLVNKDYPADDGLGTVRQLMLMARRFEGWNFVNEFTLEPIPAPTRGNIESYLILLRLPTPGRANPFYALGEWCVNEGYKAALEESLGPNFAGG